MAQERNQVAGGGETRSLDEGAFALAEEFVKHTRLKATVDFEPHLVEIWRHSFYRFRGHHVYIPVAARNSLAWIRFQSSDRERSRRKSLLGRRVRSVSRAARQG